MKKRNGRWRTGLSYKEWEDGNLPRTRCLNTKRSFWVRVSALATTGMRFTRVPRRFMISISNGFSLAYVSKKPMQRWDEKNIRVTCRTNKVKASMDPQICFLMSLWLLLLTHVSFMLVVNELNDWEP